MSGEVLACQYFRESLKYGSVFYNSLAGSIFPQLLVLVDPHQFSFFTEFEERNLYFRAEVTYSHT